MKRVATVGAKFYKTHKIVSSSSSSFSSLSELAEHHGIHDDVNNNETMGNTCSTGLSPRKLRHATTCDDLSNVFENLSLDDGVETSNVELYSDDLSVSKETNSQPINTTEETTPVIPISTKSKKRVQKKKSPKHVIQPQSEANKGRKTIVLDLDETLIKSFYQEPDTFDFSIDIEFPHMGSLVQQRVYIKKRPGLESFLQTLSSKFELIMFTAALPVYADEILKQIDPSGNLFSHVLYRQHCNGNGLFPGKDLRILGRDLDHTILVDDGVMNFLQPKNGLLIKSFKGEENDRILMDMIAPFLLQLEEPDRTVYDVIDKYRKFIEVTATFDISDSIERSHYSYYINISSTSRNLYSVSC